IVVTLLATNAVATAFAFAPQTPRWIIFRFGLAVLTGVWLVATFLLARSAHLGSSRPTLPWPRWVRRSRAATGRDLPAQVSEDLLNPLTPRVSLPVGEAAGAPDPDY
ncbi:MAG: hypothetical protein ACXVF0_19975, partial [Blastococcus sp.]